VHDNSRGNDNSTVEVVDCAIVVTSTVLLNDSSKAHCNTLQHTKAHCNIVVTSTVLFNDNSTVEVMCVCSALQCVLQGVAMCISVCCDSNVQVVTTIVKS